MNIKIIIFILFLGHLFAESCLNCHKNTTDIDKFHQIKDFGCASCHGGDKKATLKEKAHKGIVLNPARLEHAKIFCAKCHKDIINRVSNSIMNTQSGIIDVLRYQFRETDKIIKSNGIKDLKKKRNLTLAEDHFSKLCAACHINQDEKVFKTYTPRGGGCVDCHRQTKAKRENNKLIHPKFTINIKTKTCLKCHNRSNRIGLSFIGQFESEGYGTPFKNGLLSNKLDKKRFFYHLPSDLHYKAGLSCIDCHTHKGIMGDGNKYLHMEEAIDISCKDCHNPKFKKLENFEKETILSILNKNVPTKTFVAVTKKNTALYNVVKENNQTILYTKNSNKRLVIPKLKNTPYHNSKIHQRLSCSACHSAWIPSCYGCHEIYFDDKKQFDWIKHKKTKGRWMELRSYLRYEDPALCVYENKIMPTAPGCQVIMNIYKNKKYNKKNKFHSFAYGAWDPHTTSKKSRSCLNCHSKPKSLGLAEGILNIKNKTLLPYYNSKKNNLDIPYPIDALVNIDGTQNQTFSRDNVRGFNKKEIDKILDATKCIICHNTWDDKIYKDFEKSKKIFKRKKCINKN